MRKIEEQMLEAIRKGVNWQSSNMMVRVEKPGVCAVYLFGNHIADVRTYYGVMQDVSLNDVKPDPDTFRRWPTRTTKSRLRALGVGKETMDKMLEGETV